MSKQKQKQNRSRKWEIFFLAKLKNKQKTLNFKHEKVKTSEPESNIFDNTKVWINNVIISWLELPLSKKALSITELFFFIIRFIYIQRVRRHSFLKLKCLMFICDVLFIILSSSWNSSNLSCLSPLALIYTFLEERKRGKQKQLFFYLKF
jgi:hypothetical protein